MSILQGFKDSVMELRGVVNHHYQDKDKAYANQASIFKINYNLWLYIYQFLWTREIASYDELVNAIRRRDQLHELEKNIHHHFDCLYLLTAKIQTVDELPKK